MTLRLLGAVLLICSTAACSSGGFGTSSGKPDQLYAPSIDPKGTSVDGILVGHRLMDAEEYELAIAAYQRAAVSNGLSGEILSGIGSANLAMGRLGQAERILRRAVTVDESNPNVWNNLGVVLMERNNLSEAAATFRKAYALDNGESDSIRDNLRLAIAKLENSFYDPTEDQQYKLVRRGTGDYLIQS